MRSKKWPGKCPQEMAAPIGNKRHLCDDFLLRQECHAVSCQALHGFSCKMLQIATWDGKNPGGG